MERRRKSQPSEIPSGINEEVVSPPVTGHFPELPYIEETIAQGGITIGVITPVKECVAIAHEGRNTLAMLKRRKDESVLELLTRLDLAIARAHEEGIFTDEINSANPTRS